MGEVRGALPSLETDLRLTLAGFVREDLDDRVLQRQPGQVALHRAAAIHHDFEEARGDLAVRQLVRRLGALGVRGTVQEGERVGALGGQGRGDSCFVVYLDEVTLPATLVQYRSGRTSADLHASLGVDLDHRQAVGVEDSLDRRHCLRRRPLRGQLGESSRVVVRQARADLYQRRLHARCLRDDGLRLYAGNQRKRSCRRPRSLHGATGCTSEHEDRRESQILHGEHRAGDDSQEVRR